MPLRITRIIYVRPLCIILVIETLQVHYNLVILNLSKTASLVAKLIINSAIVYNVCPCSRTELT